MIISMPVKAHWVALDKSVQCSFMHSENNGTGARALRDAKLWSYGFWWWNVDFYGPGCKMWFYLSELCDGYAKFIMHKLKNCEIIDSVKFVSFLVLSNVIISVRGLNCESECNIKENKLIKKSVFSEPEIYEHISNIRKCNIFQGMGVSDCFLLIQTFQRYCVPSHNKKLIQNLIITFTIIYKDFSRLQHCCFKLIRFPYQ